MSSLEADGAEDAPAHTAQSMVPPQAATLSLFGFRFVFAIVITLLQLNWNTADDGPADTEEPRAMHADEFAAVVREMFAHAYDGYMRDAFPRDDLRPLSQDGSFTLGEVGKLGADDLETAQYAGVALSLLESLSTLAVLGNVTEFTKAVAWLEEHPDLFDQDVRVNVFESMIRPLGSLVSAHMLAEFTLPELCTWCRGGGDARLDSPLLALASDLGSRLFPAFAESPSGIPFAWVNLRHGICKNETSETTLAGAGTGLLEYAMLSRLTGEERYEAAAVACLSKLWSMRSEQGLFGTHIDVREGTWTDSHASVGYGTDSYYEYLLKGYILLGDPWYWGMFASAYEAIQSHMRSGPWYADVHMTNGNKIQEVFTSIQAFFPGLQVDVGDLSAANESHRAFFAIWERFGLMPERYFYKSEQIHSSMKYYPLRPELVESTLWLFQATRDSYYQDVVGPKIIHGLNSHARVDTGGFAAIHNVETMEKENHQQSFFLSETLKYLYLLYNDTFLQNSEHAFVFTTEGHPLPIIHELRDSNEYPLSENELPARLRKWCKGTDSKAGFLGFRCSCIDLQVCPMWTEASDDARSLVPLIVESACHVLDHFKEGRCEKSGHCGADSTSCKERLCSSHGFCYTP
eukprot:TRINITY_DN37375_c0_g1_i1.p1 TRINITY_DN37375_c0_g1~~TRINITY_DN37375_c0_g1_i1.p1  ORF type:complete len:632 (-),score=112.28 TRINITY_DN37375_c0_g1_i1:39-1934(-)